MIVSTSTQVSYDTERNGTKIEFNPVWLEVAKTGILYAAWSLMNSSSERTGSSFENKIRWFQHWNSPHGSRGEKGRGGWDSKGYTGSLLLPEMTPHRSELLLGMAPHCPRWLRNVSPHSSVVVVSVSPHSSVVMVVDLSPHKWLLTQPLPWLLPCVGLPVPFL